MRKLWMSLLLAGGLSALANPAPADAAAYEGCVDESVASCDQDFSSQAEFLVGIRGWCYMIRWGVCTWINGYN